MEAIALSGGLDRFVHLRRNERALQTIKTQLDDAYRDLLVRPFQLIIFAVTVYRHVCVLQAASVLRGEVQQTQFAYQQAQFGLQQTKVQLDLKKVAAVNVCDHLSFIQNGDARTDFSLLRRNNFYDMLK
jgi:hypothetical protein